MYIYLEQSVVFNSFYFFTFKKNSSSHALVCLNLRQGRHEFESICGDTRGPLMFFIQKEPPAIEMKDVCVSVCLRVVPLCLCFWAALCVCLKFSFWEWQADFIRHLTILSVFWLHCQDKDLEFWCLLVLVVVVVEGGPSFSVGGGTTSCSTTFIPTYFHQSSGSNHDDLHYQTNIFHETNPYIRHFT